MKKEYSSLHTICAVDWNGGTLFFQWILTLATYINENHKSALIIILLGPNSDLVKLNKLCYPKNIKILKYTDINIAEIVSLKFSNYLKTKERNLYIHGWDSFSRIFIQKHSLSIASLFNKLNVYSDGSKPIINLNNADFLNLNDEIKFDQLTTLAFTSIEKQKDLNYLLKGNNLLNKSLIYKIFSSIKHNLIPSDFHVKACNLFFPKIKTNYNKQKIKKGSTLIVLRYWGMSAYKFSNYKNTIEIIMEQIKNIESPKKNKQMYIKTDSRLSPNIQDEVIKQLSSIYDVFLYDDIIRNYKNFFKYYDFSFGLEILFYNFPSLFLNFKKIYSFDGSFCWFISQLSNSILKKFNCDLYIGANSKLPKLKKERSSTLKHIEDQSYAQILPFLNDERFKVNRVKYSGNKKNLFKIKNIFFQK